MPSFRAVTALAAVLLSLTPAAAVSSEDAYLAARDRYIASFKGKRGGKDEKAVFARHDKAVKDLQSLLRTALGSFSTSGFPVEGKLNLESLFPDDMDYGLLDALVYRAGDDSKSLVVTTDSLLDKWLKSHPVGSAKGETSAAAAVKSEDFYTRALMSDSTVANYGEIPVTAPPDAKFAHAMLALVGNGVLVPGAPEELFVAVENDGRVFIVEGKLTTPVPPIPACDGEGAEAAKKADAVDAAFMKGGGKNQKLRQQVEDLHNQADAAVLACFHAKVADTPAFKAAEAQAAAILAGLAAR